MPRRLVLAIACLSLAALSFDHRPLAPATAAVDAPAIPPALSPEAAAIAKHLGAFHTGLAPHERDALAETIVTVAERRAFTPSLILAVMVVESGNYNFALSSAEAMGLMQLLPDTAEELAAKLGIPWYGPQTLFDPLTNVRLGTAYLRRLVDHYGGRIDVALAAYNWGPGRIDRRLRRGQLLPAVYARRVLDVYGATPVARESRS